MWFRCDIYQNARHRMANLIINISTIFSLLEVHPTPPNRGDTHTLSNNIFGLGTSKSENKPVQVLALPYQRDQSR